MYIVAVDVVFSMEMRWIGEIPESYFALKSIPTCCHTTAQSSNNRRAGVDIQGYLLLDVFGIIC